MRVGDETNLSRRNLLWEPSTVVQYLRRDDAYARLRDRATDGIPTLSAHVYASILVQLHRRLVSGDRLALNLEELAEFRVAELDRATAESFAAAYRLCLASARNQGRDEPETWFVWQVALNHLHGCRILTNDRPRYAGIVASEDLV